MHYLDHGDLYPMQNDDPKLMDAAILLGELIKTLKNAPMFGKARFSNIEMFFDKLFENFQTNAQVKMEVIESPFNT